MSHQYLVTQPFQERDPEKPLPTLRDPDLLIYFREDGGGLVMGGYEHDSEPAFMPEGTGRFDSIPPDFNGRLLEDDWDRFKEITDNSIKRVPVMDEVTITKLINGPEAFTPDNEFCLGETEVAGLFVAAGFCAHGLAGAGGIGKVMAEWIDEGEPSLDLWHMDIRRFGAQYRSPSYTHARTRETYETYYDIRYPNHERQAGRPLRVSPATAWHREHDAAFGEKSGWERVNWYESNAAAGDESLRPRGWAGQHWSPAIGAEHRATREGVAVFDESSFAKLEIAGPGAAAAVERLCDNRVAREPGKITYTQMLNSRGGIECDFTVARLGEDRFSIVTGTAFGNHDREWIRRHLPGDGTVQVRDVTSQYACFGIWGPKAREVLAPLTPQDLGNEAFPYMSLREITVGNVPVRALRVTYVGELGWELYCPTEYGLGLWRALWEAGEPHGIVAGGYRAIDSLRLEKGYLVWGADITPDETPYEAGLGFAVKLDKEGGFIGRDALAEAKEAGAPHPPGHDPARGPALGRARQRARPDRRRDLRAGDHRRLRLYGRALDRLRLRAAGAGGARRLRSKSRSSAAGSAARSPRARCSTPRASGSRPRPVSWGRQGLAELRIRSRPARRRRSPSERSGLACASSSIAPRVSGSTRSRWVASARNSCAVVSASPSAWWGRWTGSRNARASSESPLGARPEPKCPVRPSSSAASAAVSTIGFRSSSARRPSAAERKPRSTAATWAITTRPVSAASSSSSSSSSGGASSRSTGRRPWMRMLSPSGIRAGRTSL